ncbi:T-lymphoma invasion and metastasis-inducing protein 1 [Strongyloides ratti]|uniref:T-lymphoma invasion and metastasis-inducing protein 1 n=1 Tax=Strongyloides ratti TaxID=34506 RepID=A0A090L280_STRRB|nr:T-lymphoma invasion and metastasis-inducing protein 1 [Strongyloides ratti]CEF63787.1 T-lymphoma invasion and metastasis-inducing protein 1 [Strongyloides ratti]
MAEENIYSSIFSKTLLTNYYNTYYLSSLSNPSTTSMTYFNQHQVLPTGITPSFPKLLWDTKKLNNNSEVKAGGTISSEKGTKKANTKRIVLTNSTIKQYSLESVEKNYQNMFCKGVIMRSDNKTNNDTKIVTHSYNNDLLTSNYLQNIITNDEVYTINKTNKKIYNFNKNRNSYIIGLQKPLNKNINRQNIMSKSFTNKYLSGFRFNKMGNEFSGCKNQEECFGNKNILENDKNLTKSLYIPSHSLIRFSAEVYKLSNDRTEWKKLHNNMLTISSTERYHVLETFFDITGFDIHNEIVFTSYISSSSSVKKSSNRFIIWNENNSIYGLNFLLSKDAEEFCAILSSRITKESLTNDCIIAETSIIIESIEKENCEIIEIIEKKEISFQQCFLTLQNNGLILLIKIKGEEMAYAVDMLDSIILYDNVSAFIYLSHPSKVFIFKCERPTLMYNFFIKAIHDSNIVLTNENEISMIQNSLKIAQSEMNVNDELNNDNKNIDNKEILLNNASKHFINFMFNMRIYVEEKKMLIDDKVLLSQVEKIAAMFVTKRHTLTFTHLYCAANRDISIKKYFSYQNQMCINVMKRSDGILNLKNNSDNINNESYKSSRNSNEGKIKNSKSFDTITTPTTPNNPTLPQELSISNLKAMFMPLNSNNLEKKCIDENFNDITEKSNINLNKNDKKKRFGETYVISELDEKKEEFLVRNVIELVDSERVFVKDLNELKNKSIELLGPKLKMIIGELSNLHCYFLNCLEEAKDDITINKKDDDYQFHCQTKNTIIRISTLFINKSSKFKIYSDYSAAYTTWLQNSLGNNQLKEKMKQKKKENLEKCQNIESLLIKPIQRILRYPLFLEKIVDSCNVETIEYKQSKQALSRLQELASYINEMQRFREQFGMRLDDFANNNKKYLEEKGMNLDMKELLMFAHVKLYTINVKDKISKKVDGVILIFNTLVIIFIPEKKKDKNHKIIPINECIVINSLKQLSKDTNSINMIKEDIENTFQIMHINPYQKNHSNFLIQCSCKEIKSQLLRNLNKAIKINTSGKNCRPLSGSSQSDRGYESEK